MWRLAGRKSRVGTLIKDNSVSGEIIAIFLGSWFSDWDGVTQRERSAQTWRRLRNVHVLLHVRAYGDCPVSVAMTHVRWLHGESGHESTGYTRGVVHCVGGLRAWPIDKCPNKDAGRRQSETPTPCACEKVQRQIEVQTRLCCRSSRVDNETFWKVP